MWVTVSFTNSSVYQVAIATAEVRPTVFLRRRNGYSSARWARTKPASGKTSGDAAELVSTWKSFCITYCTQRDNLQMKINADMKNYKWESKVLVVFDLQVWVPTHTETSACGLLSQITHPNGGLHDKLSSFFLFTQFVDVPSLWFASIQ